MKVNFTIARDTLKGCANNWPNKNIRNYFRGEMDIWGREEASTLRENVRV